MGETAAYRGEEEEQHEYMRVPSKYKAKPYRLPDPPAQQRQQQQQPTQDQGFIWNVCFSGLLITAFTVLQLILIVLNWETFRAEYDGELSISEFCAKSSHRYCMLLVSALVYSTAIFTNVTNIGKVLKARGFPSAVLNIAWILQTLGLLGFLMLGIYKTNKQDETPSTDATYHKLGAVMFVMCSNLGMLIQASVVCARSNNRMSCVVIALCTVSILAAVMFGCTIAANGPALVTLEVFSVVLIIVCYNLSSWTIPDFGGWCRRLATVLCS